jgi:hypothetical protein
MFSPFLFSGIKGPIGPKSNYIYNEKLQSNTINWFTILEYFYINGYNLINFSYKCKLLNVVNFWKFSCNIVFLLKAPPHLVFTPKLSQCLQC